MKSQSSEPVVSSWMILPMARQSGLESRLRALLKNDTHRVGKPGTTPAAAVGATLLLIAAMSVFRLGQTPASAAGIRKGMPPVVATGTAQYFVPASLPARFAKVFAGGGRIILKAVGALPDGTAPDKDEEYLVAWWRPDGSRYDLRLPLKTSSVNRAKRRAVNGKRYVQFLFDLTGLTSAQIRALSPGFEHQFDDILTDRDGAKTHELILTRQEPIGKRELTLTPGISSGLPVDVTVPAPIGNGNGLGSAGQLSDDYRAAEFRHAPVTAPLLYDATGFVNGPNTGPTFALLLDRHSLRDPKRNTLKFRLLDAQGKPVEATLSSRFDGIKTFIEIFRMSPDDAKRVASYVVESEPTEYMTFNNISLAPREITR